MATSDGVYVGSLVRGLTAPSRAAARRIGWKRLPGALALALGVGAACYVGMRLGLAFGLPATQVPVLWPPGVILVVALLLAPRSLWWVALAAALPAQLQANALIGVPLPVALLSYVCNAGQALLAVVLMRRFGGGVPRFDSFRSTASFVAAAAVIAPAVGSILLGALLLLVGWGPGARVLWWPRFLTDVLSALALLPPALLLLTSDLTRLRHVRPDRYAEAGLLVLGLALVGLLVLEEGLSRLQNLPAFLYAPLGLLLWAGLRFGVVGVSASLLIIAASCLWSASKGLGPFSALSPADSVLGLQLFLVELGFPVTLMAALVDERRRSVSELRERKAQVRSLAGKLIAAQEQERTMIARELHDEVGQSLTTVKINLDTMRLIDDVAALPELLDEGAALVSRALEQVRDLSLLLRPSLLDHLGLEAALHWLLDSQARRVGYLVRFSASGLQPAPSPETAIICYRVAQEALTNVARHARAKHVSVDVRAGGGQLRLTIRDDGVGFDPAVMRERARRGGSLGLLSLEERAALGRGRLRIDSAPGQGTTLTLTLPHSGAPAPPLLPAP